MPQSTPTAARAVLQQAAEALQQHLQQALQLAVAQPAQAAAAQQTSPAQPRCPIHGRQAVSAGSQPCRGVNLLHCYIHLLAQFLFTLAVYVSGACARSSTSTANMRCRRGTDQTRQCHCVLTTAGLSLNTHQCLLLRYCPAGCRRWCRQWCRRRCCRWRCCRPSGPPAQLTGWRWQCWRPGQPAGWHGWYGRWHGCWRPGWHGRDDSADAGGPLCA